MQSKSVEPVTIYAMRGSAPCRAVIILARSLDIPHQVVEVDLHNSEHKSDWFLRINPQHCVPTITDQSGALWESRAILLHLMASAGQKTAQQRTQQLMGTTEQGNVSAHVLRALFWDGQTLYAAIGKFVYPQLFGQVPAGQLADERAALDSALDSLLAQIEAAKERTGNQASLWVCGSREPTVADLSIATSLSMLRFVPSVLQDWPRIQTYVDRVAWRFEPHWTDVNAGLDEWLASMAQHIESE